jgi:hypothetical protein
MQPRIDYANAAPGAARRGTVTLVYSSHDEEHNNAVALQLYLRAKARRPTGAARTTAADRPRRSG